MMELFVTFYGGRRALWLLYWPAVITLLTFATYTISEYRRLTRHVAPESVITVVPTGVRTTGTGRQQRWYIDFDAPRPLGSIIVDRDVARIAQADIAQQKPYRITKEHGELQLVSEDGRPAAPITVGLFAFYGVIAAFFGVGWIVMLLVPGGRLDSDGLYRRD